MQRAYPTRGIRFLAVTLTVGLITTVASYATDVFTDPVGFISTPITNVNNGYNSFALPFQTMRNDAGAISAVSDLDATHAQITVVCATCATANYATATSLNYVEFRSGTALGRRYSVTANTATTINLLTGGDDLVALGVTSGDKWAVHPYWRIADVFGAANSGLLSNASASTKADNVLVWNGANYTFYWPKNNGLWQGGGGGTDPLMADESVLLLRRGAATQTNILVMGEVRTTNFVSVLGSGYNLLGNSYPASTVVSNLNLIGTGSGFIGGNASTKSDQVLVWNGANFDTLWYKTNNPAGWQGPIGGGYPVLPTSTYYILLAAGHHGNWPRPLPYTP